jgi:hypothetical protein
MLTDTNRLAHLAVRAITTAPGLLLATQLAELTDEWLATRLGCAPAAVVRLRLCYPPRPANWSDDVAAIAQHVGCDAGALAILLGTPSR